MLPTITTTGIISTLDNPLTCPGRVTYIYSSCYLNIGSSGITSGAEGANLKIEQCYFQSNNYVIAITSYADGYVQLLNNMFGPGTTTSIAQAGIVSIPYSYT